MAPRRKNATSSQKVDDTVLRKPSEVALGSHKKAPLIQISEDEQLRLIKQSGILERVKEAETEKVEYVEERMPLAEEIFNAILYIIPTSFLLMLMEILIHQQYQQVASFAAILDRMVSGVPILSMFVFYTLRYKSYRKMQLFLFVIALLSPSRMIYLFNKASFVVNMKQAPPLATVWIYSVVQLDLLPAVLSLAAAGAFVWWKELRLVF